MNRMHWRNWEPAKSRCRADWSAPDFEFGVIAGTRNLRKIIPGTPSETSDGVVTVEETRAPGMKDFLLVPATHTTIVWSDEVHRQTAHFLRNGRFDHSGEGS